jgi:hypothetical protein
MWENEGKYVSTCGEKKSSMIIVSIVNDLFTGYTKGLKPK